MAHAPRHSDVSEPYQERLYNGLMVPMKPAPIIRFDFARLFAALKHVPNLQRRDWEQNQTGIDRGIEAALIQRSPRELATYALSRLRLACMPHLQDYVQDLSVDEDLVAWGLHLGGAAKSLARMMCEPGSPAEGCAALTAAAVLRYYRCREDPNPLVRSPWNEFGLERLATIDPGVLDEPPIRGAFWQAKLRNAQRLVCHVRQTQWDKLTDDAVMRSLQTITGRQTASMVALFWLGRPVPIIDTYLERLLRRHNLLSNEFSFNARGQAALAEHLRRGAAAYARMHSDWTSSRVLACLYLWACEIGRLRCDCSGVAGPTCPLVGLLSS